MTRLDSAIAAARAVRAEILRDPRKPRKLHGQCGLASILIAVAVGDPQSLRLGFFMRHSSFMGRRGRFPHVHAWNVVDGTIVDATATQFGSYPAVHVVPSGALRTRNPPSYVETADGARALREMVRDWSIREDDDYREPLRHFRALERRRA